MNNLLIEQMIDWVHEERDNGKEPVTWWVGARVHDRLCKSFFENSHLFDLEAKNILFYDLPIRWDPSLGDSTIILETK